MKEVWSRSYIWSVYVKFGIFDVDRESNTVPVVLSDGLCPWDGSALANTQVQTSSMWWKWNGCIWNNIWRNEDLSPLQWGMSHQMHQMEQDAFNYKCENIFSRLWLFVKIYFKNYFILLEWSHCDRNAVQAEGQPRNLVQDSGPR